MADITRRNSGGVKIKNMEDVVGSISSILPDLPIEVSLILVDTRETF